MARSQRAERPAALEEFMVSLRELRERAGDPSFRRMASRSGAVSHATLHLTVTGYRLQPWETVREFVRACDGDETEWQARWQQVSEALSGNPDRSGNPEDTEDSTTPEDTASDEREELAAPEPPDEPGPRRFWRRSTWLVAALVVVVLATVFLALRATSGGTDDGEASANGSGTGNTGNEPVHEGDSSRLLRDVTYPDGSVVPTNSQFVKIWEVRNTGTVHWRNRHLQRIDIATGPDQCTTPDRVPVPDTAPGQTVQIAVTVRTPTKPAVDCKVRWKMTDASGQVLMPGSRPIYFEVQVR